MARAGKSNALLELLEAPEAERQARELAALEDDAMFEELERAEDDLLDAALRGELEPAARERFNALAASSPRLRERMATGRSLHLRAVERQSSSPFRGRGILLAAAASVGIAALGLGFLVSRGLEGAPSAPRATVEPYGEALPPPGEDSSVPGEARRASDAPLVLALIAPRGSETIPLLARPAAGGVLVVHAEVGEEPYPSFRLTLLDRAERERASWEDLRPEWVGGLRVVAAEVPWDDLALGRSLLVLAGEAGGGSVVELAYHELEVVGAGEG